jgi:hypothetical protein
MKDEVREAFGCWEDAFDYYEYAFAKYAESVEGYKELYFQKGFELSRQNIGIVPPAWKDCPECQGTGKLYVGGNFVDYCECHYCKDKGPKYNRTYSGGRIWLYYTPEQYTAWMKEHVDSDWEMPDGMPVWVRFDYADKKGRWGLFEYGFVKTKLEVWSEVIVATAAGKPDEGWRP